MSQLKLPNQLARELTDLDSGNAVTWEDANGFGVVEVVVNRPTGGRTRWSLIHEIVLRTKDGKLWHRLYKTGATESQDERPFEYEGDEIPFDEAQAVEYKEMRYIPLARG